MDMPPASATKKTSSNPEQGLGLGLLLGCDYDKKKHKLKQELQLDYECYVSTKKDMKKGKPSSYQAVSLPIDDKIWIQEKLREERNKEYNLFLQQQAHIKRLKRVRLPTTSKIQGTDAAGVSVFSQSPVRERPASRRDAATLTEEVDNGNRTWSRDPCYQRWRRWLDPCGSDEEPCSDREEELEFRNRRMWDAPELNEGNRTRGHRTNRAPLNKKKVEAEHVPDHDNNQCVGKSEHLEAPDMRTAARSRPVSSENRAEFTTGLMIGTAEEQATSRMRKERYRQELLTQIAEQQRNKIREKKLELSVAAAGATDPENEADRIKRPAHRRRAHRVHDDPPGRDHEVLEKNAEDREQKTPSGRSHYGIALREPTENTVPGSDRRDGPSVDEDFSDLLVDVSIPRVGAVPPPLHPTVTNNYRTPYDAACYYGTRNPVDPNLPFNNDYLTEGVQQSGSFRSPRQRPPPLHSGGRAYATHQHILSPLFVGEFSADKQRRDSERSYQEALREQIIERQEHKKREKEAKKRYDARMEAEMMTYNPWGKSGGGAPITDQQGNLVYDLNQMHRTNEESYRNPVLRNSGQSSLVKNGNSPGSEAVSHRLSGFSNQPEHLHKQDRYKEDLKQQIEENKRKKEEERERQRIEEEEEEKRVAEQRACMMQEYEEEQRQQKKRQNQSWIHEPKTQQKEEEKRVRQEVGKMPESTRDKEEERKRLDQERDPSPPLPASHRKQTNLVASRSSSVLSQLISRTEHSVSAPHCRPVQAKTDRLRDEQQEVITELSALRRRLRKEQRQLEVQLGRNHPQESRPNRPAGQAGVEAFELAHKRGDRSSTRSQYSGPAPADIQNIQEFVRLKYRDTASREEVRHRYPDPPTDVKGLDIQQQALLREQQRKIRLVKRAQGDGFLDQQLYHPHSGNKSGHYARKSLLPSETTFIDIYSGDVYGERVLEQGSPQHSPERREWTEPWHRHDETNLSTNQRGQNPRPLTGSTLECDIRPHSLDRITKPDSGGRNSTSERLSGDEADVTSPCSVPERPVSVDTVATEPWLRPGTSTTGRHQTTGRRLHPG